MADKPDFGFYGKGLEGYAHYKAATDRATKGGGGGGGNGGGGNNGGCLSVFALLVIAGWAMTALLR